jgi:hypothetical protein
MFWGLKSPQGFLFLVGDDMATPTVLEAWETYDSQLVCKVAWASPWSPAGPGQQELLRATAKQWRERLQRFEGDMLP